MSRLSVTLAAAVVAVVAVALMVLQPASARDPDTRTVCVQVPQKPDRLDEQFVAGFIDEQRSQGRVHFETVTGLSTVLCAW